MFELPDLPYAYDALEPFIDTETMEFHHDEHHRTYVEKLNEALERQEVLQGKSIEQLLSDLQSVPLSVRKDVENNGGGHFNHSMLWKILNPDKARRPFGKIQEAIVSEFGTFEGFQAEFSSQALDLFGSGYVWLCADEQARLSIRPLPNQTCPLSIGFTPLFLMDLWEHAYYLQHQNRREEYIETFWQVANWEEVESSWLAHLKKVRSKRAA